MEGVTTLATMTPSQKHTLQAALECAKAAGCRILGTGMQAGNGARMIVVSNSHNAAAYVVAVDGGHLTCGCPGGRYNRLCMHRALAHAFLVAEDNAARQQTQQPEKPATRPAYRRDQARGYNNGRAISLWR